MGQVFRHLQGWNTNSFVEVVIPDLWGKSSDANMPEGDRNIASRNPRFVGQVFRRANVRVQSNLGGRNPRFVGQVFRRISSKNRNVFKYLQC